MPMTQQPASECEQRAADFVVDVARSVLRRIARCARPPAERDGAMRVPLRQPENPVTGHVLTGVNRLALTAFLLDRNLTDPRFMTAYQVTVHAKAIGKPLAIRDGARGLMVLRGITIGEGDQAGGGVTGVLADMVRLTRSGVAPADAHAAARAMAGEACPKVYLVPAYMYHASQIAHLPPLAAVQGVESESGRRRADALEALGLDGFDGSPAEATADLASAFERSRFAAGDPAVDRVAACYFATLAAPMMAIEPYLPDAAEIARLDVSGDAAAQRVARAGLAAIDAADALSLVFRPRAGASAARTAWVGEHQSVEGEAGRPSATILRFPR
jgi:hypothetical protein